MGFFLSRLRTSSSDKTCFDDSSKTNEHPRNGNELIAYAGNREIVSLARFLATCYVNVTAGCFADVFVKKYRRVAFYVVSGPDQYILTAAPPCSPGEPIANSIFRNARFHILHARPSRTVNNTNNVTTTPRTLETRRNRLLVGTFQGRPSSCSNAIYAVTENEELLLPADPHGNTCCLYAARVCAQREFGNRRRSPLPAGHSEKPADVGVGPIIGVRMDATHTRTIASTYVRKFRSPGRRGGQDPSFRRATLRPRGDE